MKISHPKVKKIIAQSQRRIKKLTGNENMVLVVIKEPSVKTSFEQVLQIVCDVRKVPVEKMYSVSRKRELVITRQLVTYYAKICCGMTLVTIAEKMGGQHHTTVMYSISTIRDLIESGNPVIYHDVKAINQRLEELALAAPAPSNGTANKC